MDEVRYQEQPGRRAGHACPGVGIELKQGVERHELNARALENLFTRDARENLLHHALRPFVPVADRVFQKITPGIDKSIIHTPAIHSHASDGPADSARPLACLARAGLYLVENLGEVPAQA